MQLHLQQILWAYTIVFSILILAIAEISCENEEQSLDENSNRFVRSIKATPLRWGKRNIEKRSTAEEEDGSSEELTGARETRSSPLRWGKREQALLRPVRATPLRWGKRSVDSQLYELLNKHEDEEPLEKRVPLDELLNKPEADWEKRAPLRWGKRAPARFGKRAPARFGKRAPSRFGKRAPMRFGKRAPMRFGKRDENEDLTDMDFQAFSQNEYKPIWD